MIEDCVSRYVVNFQKAIEKLFPEDDKNLIEFEGRAE